MLAELAEPLLEWGARGRGPPRALKYPRCTPPGGGEGRRKRGRRPASLQILSPPRPRVPGLTALGPSSCQRRRPEAPAAPEQSVAVRVTSPRWGFQRLPAKEGEQRKFSLCGGAKPPTPTLLSYFGLSFGISPSPGLDEGLFGPLSLFSEGLFLLFFLLSHLHFPVSACSLHSAPFSFQHPTWHSLQEKSSLAPSRSYTLDHYEPDLSPEFHSLLYCPKSRVLKSGI